jgi:23S rRNA pseudouridine1911/1915/1917 synthase
MTVSEAVETVVVPASLNGERVDKILAQSLEDVTRTLVQRWIKEGRVLIGDHVCKGKERVPTGTQVVVTRGQELITRAEPDDSVPFSVCYEDESILVVNKPAGVVVHPARGHAQGTLVNGILSLGSFKFEEDEASDDDETSSGEHFRPGIVHRIDKDTSGLLVVAKTSSAREALKEQFAKHTIRRSYVALVYGVPELGKIETAHGRDPRSRLRFTTRVREGKRAVTWIRRAEPLAQGSAALVECELETGRTHQIRVHLLECRGTPLLADAVYRRPVHELDSRVGLVAEQLGRQALHARTLGIVHPESGKELYFESDLPDDFQAARESLLAMPAALGPSRNKRG